MQIPTNQIASQNGIILRVFDGQTVSPFRHLHRDDYYGFCLLSKGKIRASIDFQEEIVLRAKRELAYSSESPQEIAWRLGFTDYAYFSRLYKKSTGINPREFRSKYHE